MASGTAVVVPSNEANIMQTAPGLPSVALQASEAIPYPQYGAQQLPINAPQQVPQKDPLEGFLKAEPKVLGTVEILIGLIHIGFVPLSLYFSYYFFLSMVTIGGYHFWGGICFISSGSLCVAAANCPNRRLVKSSVGMNITSAIMSLSGSIMCISDLLLIRNGCTNSCNAISRLYSVLLLFSLLEFCIAVSLAHFGCQATCCSNDQPTMVFVPYQVIRGGAVAAEPNPLPPPPTYDNMVTKPQ